MEQCLSNERKIEIMKKTFLFLFASIVTMSVVTAQKVEVITSNKPGWHKIGETNAMFKSDRDVLTVLGADKFKAIQIKVTDAPIRLEDLEVYYENDTKEDIQVRSEFKKGEKSRVINLKGGDRKLKKVVFVYHSIPNWKGERAHVELYGLK